MNRERNIIKMDEHGNITMPTDIRTIAMSEWEICELFGITAPTFRAAIKAVYKSGILKEHQAQQYIRLSDKCRMFTALKTILPPSPSTMASVVPKHVGYKPVIGKFLNLYEPIDHKPTEGVSSSICSLVKHIFGEQYESCMDYLQLLYLQPVQKLPILLLVSEEHITQEGRLDEWCNDNLRYLANTFGRENIVSAVLRTNRHRTYTPPLSR